jgi:hypothetical protein
MNGREQALPLENFIKALASQLDVVQETMRLKATAGYPLTFAVKDLSMDLRAHLEVRDNVIRVRPAGPEDAEASILHLALTGITRPTIVENTRDVSVDKDAPSIKEVLGDSISEAEQRQLEWAGIRNVDQLRELHREGGEQAIERVSSLPVDRLRAALTRASQPLVRGVDRVGGDGLLRIRGFNLTADGEDSEVRIAGEAADVVEASERELVVRPASPLVAGTLEVRSGAGAVATAFDLGENGGTP